MPLVPAICTQCEAQIEVDNTYEAGICKHCGTAFITEKAINKYTVYTTNNNIAGSNISVNINNELEQLIDAAEGFQRLVEYDNAFQKYKIVIDKYPQDIRGWIGCLYNWKDGEFQKEVPSECEATWLDKEPYIRWLRNACALADDNIRNKLVLDKKAYIDAINKKWEKICSVETIKKYIGEDILIYEDDFKPLRKMYVREDKLYYQIVWWNSYYTFELVSIDKNGIFTKSLAYSHLTSDKNERKMAKDWYNEEPNEILKLYSLDFNWAVKQLHIGGEKSWICLAKPLTMLPRYKIIESGNCYIASCIYGSYDCPQVWTLRRFRDYTLDKIWYGRAFIKCYYAISPILVKKVR